MYNIYSFLTERLFSETALSPGCNHFLVIFDSWKRQVVDTISGFFFPDFQWAPVLHCVKETAKRCNCAVHEKLWVLQKVPESLQVENKSEQALPPTAHVPYARNLKQGLAANTGWQSISWGLLSLGPADKAASKAAVASVVWTFTHPDINKDQLI